MKVRRAVPLLITLTLWILSPLAWGLPTNFQDSVVLSSLNQPVNLTLLPDERMLVLLKGGEIRIFDPQQSPSASTVYMTITDINTSKERGLTSLVLDPDFTTNGYIYVYYTHGSSARNRISRFTHQGDTASLASEVLIWQDNEDWSDCCHYGGGMGFGPDGKLYLTTGEEFDGAQAQDLGRAGGKVIRINKDGSIPSDNPFIDVAGALPEVWAYGLRNPYRAFWDLPSQRFYIGDVGGNVQETAMEEVNLGIAGANYGWPECEGMCSNSAYTDPLYTYSHTGNTPHGGAITAGFVYRGNQFPAEYQGTFFFGDYSDHYIKYLVFDGDGQVESANSFSDAAGSIVALVQGPEGALYYADIADGSVRRISYFGGNQPPVISTASASPVSGPAPLEVTFTGDATDPEDDAIAYRWIFGDGGEATGQSVVHTYAAEGPYTAFLEVADATGTTISEPIEIAVGQAPTVEIQQPVDGQLFRALDRIDLAGTASDDGPLAESSYEWIVDFVHNAHTHPGPDGLTGSTGAFFEINDSGHDYFDDTAYWITLRVTDESGLTGEDVVTIFPDKVFLSLSTVPAGHPLNLDDLPVDTPIDYDTLIGFRHVLTAPASLCEQGVLYTFSSWNDGVTTASREVTIPSADLALEANYVSAGSCELPESGLVVHLAADSGVTTSAGTVATWSDQSGQGNHLSASGNPALFPTGLNGSPVINFDGVGDKLERTGTLSGLAAGGADRTMFAVVNYRSNGWGGIVYGRSSCNQAFGLAVAGNGNLGVQGWCSTNDFNSGVDGVGSGWLLQSAVLQSGQLTHFQDGAVIDSRSHTYDTGLSELTIGAELKDNPYISMQVAEVLVYNRALGASERDQVALYLQSKYGGLDLPPTVNIDAPQDGATVDGPSVLVSYSLSGSGYDHLHLTVDDQPHITIEQITGSYQLDGLSDGPHTLTAELVGSQHVVLTNPEATDQIQFSMSEGGGNSPPVADDDSATVTQGLSVVIDLLDGDVDSDGTLDPSSIVTTAASNGTVADNGDGTVTYTHNGSATTSDAFTYTVDDDQGATSNSATVTITVEPADGTNQPPVADDDSATVVQGGSVQIDVLNGDTDPDGNLDPATITIQSPPSAGSLSLNADNTLTYTHDGSATTSDGFTYTVMDTLGLESNVATVTISVTEPTGGGAPTSGLVVHLSADAGVASTDGTVASWADQSGNGNDLTAAGGPALVLEGLNGQPVVDFDGVDDKLERVGGLSGLVSGNADRAMFAVVNYRSNGWGGVVYGRGSCNRSFGPAVTSSGTLGVQGWCHANDFDSGVPASGWQVQGVVLAAGQLTHYRDDSVIDQRSHTFDTVLSELTIGAQLKDSPYVSMQVAEVLIYDRALDTTEVDQVRQYFDDKYGSDSGTVNQPPVADDDSATVVQGGSVQIDVLNGDTDPDGNLDPATITIQSPPSFGSLSFNADNTLTYTHDGSATTSDGFTYTVMDTQGLESNVATVTISVTEATSGGVPTSGLVVHLSADAGVVGSGGTVTSWADQSGNGNDLTAGGDPALVLEGLNGQPVVDFDGIDDKLERVGGLSGLVSGNADRTMFAVVNYRSNGWGGVVYGRGSCNRSFGLAVTSSGTLGVQGWCHANDFDSGVPASGWQVQAAALAGGQLTHYRDDSVIDQRSHIFDTVLSEFTIGAQLKDSPYVSMQVAEVLIYDRALDLTEIDQVRQYLQEKYGAN